MPSISLRSSSCPEVNNWFAKIEFQVLSFCDVINTVLKGQKDRE